MSAEQPDAWDECAECGHDRDDHRPGGCYALIANRGDLHTCWCEDFQEAA